MAPKKTPEDPDELGTDEQINAEYKRLQIADLKIKIGEHERRVDQMKTEAARRVLDQKSLELMRERRKKTCRHRKGGRNNNFAQGNASDYSLARNTLPDGTVAIFCTRCLSDWIKPSPALRRTDPKAYAEQLKQFNEMAALPTDNSPSGGQIYLVQQAS
jgi:hypothetical protein